MLPKLLNHLLRVYEDLHSEPGKIIDTITAYFKQLEILEHKQTPQSIQEKSGTLKLLLLYIVIYIIVHSKVILQPERFQKGKEAPTFL